MYTYPLHGKLIPLHILYCTINYFVMFYKIQTKYILKFVI